MFFSKDPLSVAEEALKKRGLKYLRANPTTILTGFGMPDGQVMITLRHDVDKKTLLFLFNPIKDRMQAMESLMSGRPPFLCVHASAGHSPEQIARVCEHLLNANYSMVLGSLERDHSDGEIRLRVALPYRDNPPTPDQIGWCLEIGTVSAMTNLIELKQLLGTSEPMEI